MEGRRGIERHGEVGVGGEVSIGEVSGRRSKIRRRWERGVWRGVHTLESSLSDALTKVEQ